LSNAKDYKVPCGSSGPRGHFLEVIKVTSPVWGANGRLIGQESNSKLNRPTKKEGPTAQLNRTLQKKLMSTNITKSRHITESHTMSSASKWRMIKELVWLIQTHHETGST
jgi:hypothetical protein